MPWRARRAGIDRGRAGASPGAVALAVPLLLAATGCARQEPPPGAEVDNTPPRLVASRPEDGAVVPEIDDPLRLKFDEPVEERPSLRRELQASPAYRYRVDFGFSTIEIEPRGGWRRGAVYHVRVPPPLSDLLGNRTERPIEITFSTGPPITGTRVNVAVRDRVTGRRVRDARVLFYRRHGDSVPYTALADTADRLGLTALPPGRYRGWAFRDLNRDMRLQARLEAHDSTDFELEGPEATASLEFAIVEPDSTPPRLASATARDSQLVALQFDDHLDPEQDFERTRVVVRDTLTGRRWPVAAVGLTAGRVGWEEAARRGPAGGGAGARGDTAARGEAAPGVLPGDAVPGRDTAARARGDTAARAKGARGRAAAGRPDTAPLPSRTALVRLGRPLEAEGVYRVRVDSFLNLRHLAGGGDTLFVYTPPEDTAEAPGDTVEAAPDTTDDRAGPPVPLPDTADTPRGVPDTSGALSPGRRRPR